MIGLVRAELLKLTTTRLWWVMLLVTLFLIGVNLAVFIGFAGNPQGGLPALDTPEWGQLALSAGSSGKIFVMILGVVMLTSEYRYQTITGTFLTTPQRGRVIAAKLLAGLIVGALFALAVLIFTALIVIPTVLIAGGELSLTELRVPQIGLGTVASLALYAILGIALGALVRNQIAGIVGAVAWAYVIESVFLAIPALQVVGKWFPGGAAQALMNIDVNTGMNTGMGTDMLPPWGGAIVLVGYAVVFAVVASATTVRRDIT
ncbi:ABC transporter permease [Microtetraspora sp. NBRC 16547]|uniref:ABC transporter permease n=1 Tax=Microtetraspora sp. NBRC 16547 TaxID=3030993 RepID=UPI0024A0B6AA|nr:ABC transporter permease [Microtetraspora sp. NBRC 16547]GLX01701.1 ABC transporter permease [Microtetraspora sp. NBRC 16547]